MFFTLYEHTYAMPSFFWMYLFIDCDGGHSQRSPLVGRLRVSGRWCCGVPGRSVGHHNTSWHVGIGVTNPGPHNSSLWINECPYKQFNAIRLSVHKPWSPSDACFLYFSFPFVFKAVCVFDNTMSADRCVKCWRMHAVALACVYTYIHMYSPTSE